MLFRFRNNHFIDSIIVFFLFIHRILELYFRMQKKKKKKGYLNVFDQKAVSFWIILSFFLICIDGLDII